MIEDEALWIWIVSNDAIRWRQNCQMDDDVMVQLKLGRQHPTAVRLQLVCALPPPLAVSQWNAGNVPFTMAAMESGMRKRGGLAQQRSDHHQRLTCVVCWKCS